MPDPVGIRLLLVRVFRERGDQHLADALFDEHRWDELLEPEKASLDAHVFGVGYTVSGQRVDPHEVEVFEPPIGEPPLVAP